MFRLLLLTSTLGAALAFPRQDPQSVAESHNLKPLLLLLDRSGLERQKEAGLEVKQQRQQQFAVPSALTFGGYPYFEPQFRYPGFNQQGYPRVQPSIVVYGAGQGQPILINPGLPPGHNFLVPQQPRRPGPNVPQRPPVFVGGYPNPKPAHIPPIEKDAEEIPTDPASIPPLPSSSPGTKPEKLETFNEDNNDRHREFDFSALAGRIPALQPGHRFFILNGDDLFQDNPFNYPEDLKYTRLQSAPQYSGYPAQEAAGFDSSPLQALLVGNAATGQTYPLQSGQQFDQNLESERPQAALLRSGLPSSGDPIGQFRFTPPSESYYSFEGDDIENEAVVVDAKYQDDVGKGGTSTETQSSAVSDAELDGKFAEPSTAQASPGAIALAGKGGVAGASPKATSLAGKGGLAISSPQATAVAGADDEKVKEKNKRPAKNRSKNNK